MSWLDRAIDFGDWFTNSFVGGILSVVTGDPSMESAPGGKSANPNIYISTDQVNVNGGHSAPTATQQEAAPQEAASWQAHEQSAEAWFHATRDAEAAQLAQREREMTAWFDGVHADQQRHAAETRAGQDVTAGREQNLGSLAADPVAHYARDAEERARDEAWQRAYLEHQQAQELQQDQERDRR